MREKSSDKIIFITVAVFVFGCLLTGWSVFCDMKYLVFLLCWGVFGGGITVGICWGTVIQAKQKSAREAYANAPEIKKRVKVFQKTTKTSGGNWVSSGDGSGGGYTTDVTTKHFVSFEFAGGSRQAFCVKAEQYILMMEGEFGELTYKEHEGNIYFLDFQIKAQI